MDADSGTEGLNDLEPKVRTAHDADLPVVVALDERSRSSVLEQKGGKAWFAEHGSAEGVLASEPCQTFIVEFCGEVVGFAICIEREDSMRGRLLLVERVYVSEDFRDIGCGDSLIAAAMAFASERGCRFIEAIALPGDRETKNLYERAGITARSITVSKEISGPSTEGLASR